nr:hypothetical protein CFP56_61553 [Quercus suber]
MGTVPSTLHVKVKFPTEYGITVVRGIQQTARLCLVAIADWKKGMAERKDHAKRKDPMLSASLKKLQDPQGEQGSGCAEEVMKVRILPDTDKCFHVGKSMDE